MFYRPGGASKRINVQQDMVYTDAINGATGWLPVHKGNTVAINVARASLTFQSVAQSVIIPSAVAPEVQILLEMKMNGGDPDQSAWPIDQWQNMVVATFRHISREGWVRMRVVNINNGDGTGVALAMQVNRSGDTGAAT